MRYGVIILATLVALVSCGCGVHTISVHVDSENPGVHVVGNSGGIQQVFRNGGPNLIPDSSVLNAPAEGGDLQFLYETISRPGTYVSQVEWWQDDQWLAVTGTNQRVGIRNVGSGTHLVRLIAYRKFAGDNRSAGQDTLGFTLVTYWNGTTGLQWRLENGLFQPIINSSPVLLPSSAGDLCLMCRPSREQVVGRFVHSVRWYVNGYLFRESGVNETIRCPIPVNGTHEVRCEVAWAKTSQPQSVDAIDTQQFLVERWTDRY